MVWRFELPLAIFSLQSRPISDCQADRGADADETHQYTDKGDQREVNYAVTAEAVRTVLHSL